jgi:hypothetical protein
VNGKTPVSLSGSFVSYSLIYAQNLLLPNGLVLCLAACLVLCLALLLVLGGAGLLAVGGGVGGGRLHVLCDVGALRLCSLTTTTSCIASGFLKPIYFISSSSKPLISLPSGFGGDIAYLRHISNIFHLGQM